MNALDLGPRDARCGQGPVDRGKPLGVRVAARRRGAEIVAAAFLTALRIKGETADELEGAVAAVRERMTPWDSGMDPGSAGRHLRDRRRRRGHGQYLDGGGDCRGGLRRAGRQARQPRGHRALRQLRRAGVLGVATNLEPARVAPVPGRAANRVPVRPRVPPRPGPARAGAAPTSVPDDLQPGRAALQPGQSRSTSSWVFRTRDPGGACRAGPCPAGTHPPRRRRDRMRRPGRGHARRTDHGLGRRSGQSATRGLAARGLRVEPPRRGDDQGS